MKKAELIDALKKQQLLNTKQNEEIRRLERSINHLKIDLEQTCFDEREFEYPQHQNAYVYEAIKRALNEFELNVTEPEYGGNYQRITTYINGMDGIKWNEPEYTKNGQFSWCGAFCAFAYGSNVVFNTRHKIFPSCYRMYENWYNTPRRVKEILEGDIVVIYTSDKRSPTWGNHITLALSLPDENGDFETVEGNAKGNGPNGDRIEGVIRRTRNLKDVAFIYRLSNEDFVS